MKFRSLMTAICVLATANIVSAAPFAYIANSGTNKVSVIDTAITPTGDGSNAITATVTLPAGTSPYAYSVAVSPSGQYVYVGIQGTNKIAVIDAASNVLLPQVISLGTDSPGGLAINAAETRLYVASNLSNTLSVLDISNIKTGSGTIPEVGRVAVENVSISNPEGVVLSPDGLKAYVANSTKGSIAEISLDETNNIYLRTNLIALGNNAQPMGLTISSDGTKLYAAGFNGHASVIDTASRAVTDLPLGSGAHGIGNLSVAITPDNAKIYAPSAGYNNMYSISGTTVTELGLQNSLSNSPWGSSVVPVTPVTAPTKLYVAMNLSNDVKVFSTTDNSLLATIDLTATAGANAKSTSMGDFIGPELPYTITATSVANCTITPSGIIPVNSLGRNFSIATASGACKLIIDGNNAPPDDLSSNYTFSNVTGNHTITASNLVGTYHLLSGDWITSVGGCLQSDALHPGINCGSKSANYLEGSVVTLSPTEGFAVQAGSWTGDCTGQGATCTLTMNAPKTFGAVVIIAPPPIGGPVYNVTKGTYHDTVALATAAATTNDQIKVSTDIPSSSTDGTGTVTVKMSSQWDKATYTNQSGYSPLTLTITGVAVIVDPDYQLVL